MRSADYEDRFLSVSSGRFVAAAVRRWSPTPLCDTLGCVHPHNKGFHRNLLSRRGLFGVYFPSRVLMTFSLSVMHAGVPTL